MNELDLIRSFRSDFPAPSVAASARAERAWRRPEPRWPRWAPKAAAAAALAAAVTAAALILPSKDDTRLGTQQASAAETLRHAAAAQAGGVTRPLGAGEFWYIRRRTMWGSTTAARSGPYTVLIPEVREDWIGVQGTQRFHIRPAGQPRFPGPRDRRRWEAAGRPGEAGNKPGDYRTGPTRKPPFNDGARQVTYATLLRLPRDPQALYERLHDAAIDCECGHGVDSETFVIAGDLLRGTPIPVDLRAALLRAAALIPGIKLIPHERDVVGRPGIAVAYDDNDGERSALIFDRRTYQLLGENIRSLKRLPHVDATPGALIGGSADLESAIVDSVNRRP